MTTEILLPAYSWREILQILPEKHYLQLILIKYKITSTILSVLRNSDGTYVNESTLKRHLKLP